MRFAMIGTVLALPLAACGGGSGAAGNNSQQAATAQAEPAAALTEDPDNELVPVTLPSPVTVKAIPAAFQGRWGMVANDCDPKRADNKGLLTIAGDRLSVYESRGVATGIRSEGDMRVLFDLPMSGEGMSWTEATILTLKGDGRALIREVTAPADRVGSFRYQKCPA